MSTGGPLGNVLVYFDGGYAGATSGRGEIGIRNISPVSEGLHTGRAIKTGYLDYSGSIAVLFRNTCQSGIAGTIARPGV